MIELESDLPFLWCLSEESSEGFCAVSMVVSLPEEEDFRSLTIETSVLSFSSDSERASEVEVLEWNEDDVDLFLKLVNYRRRSLNLPIATTLRVDLEDPAIVEIINIVAAAGFGTAYMVPGAVRSYDGSQGAYHCQVGGMASLNTVNGFKPCAVVEMDEEDAVCVLLEEVQLGDPDQVDCLQRHDLLMVRRSDLLHPGFACEQLPSGSEVLH